MNSNIKYQHESTPSNYQDWINLFRKSIENNISITLNLNNKGIAKAVKIADLENIDPAMLEEMKIAEGKKIMSIIIKKEGKEEGLKESELIGIQKGKIEGKIETALNMIKNNIPIETIQLAIGFTIKQINSIKKGVENNLSMEEIMEQLEE